MACLCFSLHSKPEPVTASRQPASHTGLGFCYFNGMQSFLTGAVASSTISCHALRVSEIHLLCKVMLYFPRCVPHITTLIMKPTFSTFFWPWKYLTLLFNLRWSLGRWDFAVSLKNVSYFLLDRDIFPFRQGEIYNSSW